MATNQGPVIAEQYPSRDFGIGLNDPAKLIAQTFKLDVTGRLTGLDLPLEEQFLNSEGSLFVEIVEVTAGAIGSKVLSSVEIPHGFLTSSSLGFVSIQFLSPPVDVVPGIELAIQFRVGTGGYYGISGSIGGVVDPYEKGKLFMRHPVTTGDAWQEIADWNIYFRALVVVEQPTSPNPTPAPTPTPLPDSI